MQACMVNVFLKMMIKISIIVISRFGIVSEMRDSELRSNVSTLSFNLGRLQLKLCSSGWRVIVMV